MKEQIEKLIENLKNDPDFSTVTIFNSEDEHWEYFYIIRGYNKGRYFWLGISNPADGDHLNVMISDNTDCKPEIQKKLKQFKIK